MLPNKWNITRLIFDTILFTFFSPFVPFHLQSPAAAWTGETDEFVAIEVEDEDDHEL